LNSSRPTGSVVVYRASDVELDLARGAFVGDGAGVGQRAREAVEFGDDERVAGATGSGRSVQAGAFAVGAAQAGDTAT
jgi:hypothetical protein